MTYRNAPAAPVRHPGALYTAQLANPKQTPWQQSQSHTHGSPKAAHLCVELMCWAAAPRRLEARGRTAAWLCVPLVLEPIDETVSAGCAPPGSANVDEATADPQTTRHGAAAKIAATTLSFIVRAVRWLFAAQPYASLSRSSPIYLAAFSLADSKVGGATTLSTASRCLALPASVCRVQTRIALRCERRQRSSLERRPRAPAWPRRLNQAACLGGADNTTAQALYP